MGVAGHRLIRVRLTLARKRLDARGFACFIRPRSANAPERRQVKIDIDALRYVGLTGMTMKRAALSCLAHEIYHALEYEFGLPVSECRTRKFNGIMYLTQQPKSCRI